MTAPQTNSPPWLSPGSDGVHIRIRAVPRAHKTQIQGTLGDALKVRLQAPPVDDKANAALLEYLTDKLGLPRNAAILVQGAKGRSKTVLIRGLDPAAVSARLIP